MPSEECNLTVTLRADHAPAGRAGDAGTPWDDNPSPGDGLPADNRIDNVTLFLVTPDGLYHTLSPAPLDNAGGYYHYKVAVNLQADYVTRTPDGRHTLSGRIVALANSKEKSLDPFNTNFDISTLRTSRAIPMWGVTSFSDRELKSGSTVNIGDIKMLRAVAKISIMMADNLRDLYDIVKVEPLQEGYNLLGYLHPAGALDAASTGSLPIEGCFNPVADTAQGQAGAQPYFYGTGSPEVYCYATERHCTGEGVFPLSFNVTVKRRDSPEPAFTGQIYLCDYDQGSPVDGTGYDRLVRNHDYQFKLHLSPLDFIVSFKKWEWGGNLHLELE